MKKILWENAPSTKTPLSAENLNLMQDNVEAEINTVSSTLQGNITALDTKVAGDITNLDTKLQGNIDNASKQAQDNLNAVDLKLQANINTVDKKANENKSKIATLERNIFDSGLAVGESPLNVKDSALSEAQELSMEIAKAQETTKGYQLLNLNHDLMSENIKIDIVNNKIKLKGKANEKGGDIGLFPQFKINLTKGKYTFQISKPLKNRVSGIFAGITWLRIPAGSTSVTVDLKEDISVQFGIFYETMPNETIDVEFEVQLSKSNNSVEIEPYTGGIASPNPDYPQEIAKINQDFEVKTCGKNLFDESKLSHHFIKDDGQEVNNDAWRCSEFINVKKANYFFSFRSDITSHQIRVALYNKKKQFIKIFSAVRTTKITFANENADFVKISFDERVSGTSGNTRNVQLEEGTVATPYEPYTESTKAITLQGNEILPYNKLDIKYDGGKYKLLLEKNSEKMIFTGNENFYFYAPERYKNVIALNLAYIVNNHYREICNYFNSIPITLDGVEKGIGMLGGISSIRLYFPAQGKTLEEFKTWVKTLNTQGKPLEVINELPDNKKQIIQLAEFDDMLIMYNSITNIIASIDNVKLQVKYYRDFINTIRNLQVDASKTQTLELQLQDMETRIKALEAKAVQEPQVLEGGVQ